MVHWWSHRVLIPAAVLARDSARPLVAPKMLDELLSVSLALDFEGDVSVVLADDLSVGLVALLVVEVSILTNLESWTSRRMDLILHSKFAMIDTGFDKFGEFHVQ